jgi:hypothetical protein
MIVNHPTQSAPGQELVVPEYVPPEIKWEEEYVAVTVHATCAHVAGGGDQCIPNYVNL